MSDAVRGRDLQTNKNVFSKHFWERFVGLSERELMKNFPSKISANSLKAIYDALAPSGVVSCDFVVGVAIAGVAALGRLIGKIAGKREEN